MSDEFTSIDDARERLGKVGYLADEPAALVSYLAGILGKPVLVEGPAGVGKTELAKAVSRATGRNLIRLQCYEGLDEAKALYEWNYRKQLLRIQTEAADTGWKEVKDDIFGEDFLLARPLLNAITAEEIAVISGRSSRNSAEKMSSCTASQPVPDASVWMRSSCLR